MTKTKTKQSLQNKQLQTQTSETTSWTQIEIVSISDIHLGHPSNPAEYVIAGLEKKLTYQYLKGVNLLFIVGDVFDRGLTVNHRDIPHIVSWIRRLLSRCARLNISVIVIEGTPSHDRLQSQLFVAINDAALDEDKCKLRYIKEVSIEYIEEYGLDILCIPDEKNTSDEITYRQVKDLMKSRAIEKFDFGLIHGFFDFQVPTGHHCRYHDSSLYRPLVRYLYFVGHDHEYQQNGNIIIQGSPDRQRHGMESPKGFVRATVYRNGKYKTKFEENEHAMVFRTLNLLGDLDSDNDRVHEFCNNSPRRSHLRLVGPKSHPLFSSLDSLRVKYPFITFTKKDEDGSETTEVTTILDQTEEEYIPFTIDSSNIKTIILERLSKPLLTESEKQYFDELMESVI